MPFDAQAIPFNLHSTSDIHGDTVKRYRRNFLEDAPEHWTQDFFLVDGEPINYYVARAENELGVMVGCSGLKSNNPLSIEAVQAYNNAGISVILMALPNPERGLGFMPHFRKVFERFALDEKSPVHTIFPKKLPKFLYGHSTGGLLALRTLTKTLITDSFKDMGYKSANIESPFSDTAGASLHHSSRLGRSAFNRYARWHKDKLPKETLGGLWYLHYSEGKNALHASLPNASKIERVSLKSAYALNTTVRAIKDRFFPNSHDKSIWFLNEGSYRTPTYGQILEDQQFGRKFYTRLNTLKNPQTAIPTSIIASYNDPFSCTPTTIDKIVKPLHTAFYSAQGLHNPLSEDAESLQYSIEQIIPHLLNEALPKGKENEPASRWSLLTSGSRFARALQQSTRHINPLASGLKSFFGGCVRDSKVGAETEGRAMDTSNALRLQ